MTEEMKSVIEALKQVIQTLIKASGPTPTFKAGDLIGIGDQRLFFVEEFRDGKMRVMAYSPVGYYRFKMLSNCENAIDSDEDDSFHQAWEDAVTNRETEDSYSDFAESLFTDEQDECNPIWFYKQELDGAGAEQLKDNDELRSRVSKDMGEFWCEDIISSWENADSSELPELWDVVYSKEAVDWLERQRKEEAE